MSPRAIARRNRSAGGAASSMARSSAVARATSPARRATCAATRAKRARTSAVALLARAPRTFLRSAGVSASPARSAATTRTAGSISSTPRGARPVRWRTSSTSPSSAARSCPTQNAAHLTCRRDDAPRSAATPPSSSESPRRNAPVAATMATCASISLSFASRPSLAAKYAREATATLSKSPSANARATASKVSRALIARGYLKERS